MTSDGVDGLSMNAHVQTEYILSLYIIWTVIRVVVCMDVHTVDCAILPYRL